ncbi:transposase [Edwardsiella piscicida]|uniref:TnpA n=1 Tax=Edwardsiella anguillarum ET080813 TaxID=667120 RepID=A0A076LQX9_9GAMM|nr:TnpA [Edwardsiella anguillarum ET080813]GAJ66685.1 transposase [Edwardsiella piscicida]
MLKIFGDGEWKVQKPGKERYRIWRKLHLTIDVNTHDIICATPLVEPTQGPQRTHPTDSQENQVSRG